jgi:3-methyladenine DNA glycosylase AlkD
MTDEKAELPLTQNRTVTSAADFIDSTLRAESSEERAVEDAERVGGGLRFYGASVGAVRGTIRDAHRRHPGMTHDEITALASELWSVPVFERRLAAIVLLQGHVADLFGSDLTRLEQFIRDGRVPELVDPLAVDVVRPLINRLEGADASRARRIIDRWATEADPKLRRAASQI